MSGMAGKGYSAENTDRLKTIPLGSGNVYMIPYVEGSTMPTDAQFEQNANMALKIADIGYVLETGNIVKEGAASQLLNDDAIKKAYLGE